MAEDYFHQQGLDNLKHGCNPEKDHVASYENFAVFSLSQYQYIILLIAFAKVLTIGEYSATKIHFFPQRQKIVKKFPPNFHFQGWKSFPNCTFKKSIKILGFLG